MYESSIRTVHDDDLMALLEKLELADPFGRGELQCRFCGDTITWDNLHALYPTGGQIGIVCDKRGCLDRMAQGLDHNLTVQ